MKTSDQKNSNLKSYPEDLSYSDENWQNALNLIESYEKRKRLKLIMASSFFVALCVSALFWFHTYRKDVSPQYVERVSRLNQEASDTSINALAKHDSGIVNEKWSSLVNELNSPSIKEVTTKESPEILSNSYLNQFITSTNNSNSKQSSLKINSSDMSSTQKSIAQSSINTEKITSEQNTKTIAPYKEETQYNEGAANNSEGNINFQTLEDANFLKIRPIPFEHKVGSLASREINSDYYNLSQDRIYVELGTSPWVDYGKGSSGWKDFSIGLTYERKINSKWKVNGSFQYFMINDLTQDIIRTEVQYIYGYDSTKTILYTDRLHYFSIPIGVNYNLNSRWELIFRAGASYMFWTENRLLTQRTSFDERSKKMATNTSGYLNTYRRLNFFVQPGVTFRINEQFWIGSDFQLGLSDITPNNTFNVGNYDRNSKLVMYLKYRIW